MKGKKQHIGSHSRRSFPVKQGLPKEEADRYKEKVLMVDGKITIITELRKTGLKFIKKFINKKRRGFLKQENSIELKNMNDESD